VDAADETRAVPSDVRRLVERFRDNRAVYTTSGYKETQLRRELVGWEWSRVTPGYEEPPASGTAATGSARAECAELDRRGGGSLK